MSSVLRPVRKRKKVRTLGPVDVIDRKEYAELDVDTKVELIRSLVPLGLLHVEELLDAEVTALAGGRYARKDASVGGRRHGSNPGTVGLAGQRVPIRVPRIRHVAGSEMPLRSYEALHGERAVNDLLLKRVLYGISCRNYEAAAAAIPGAIGLSGSTVSRGFIQASAAKLRELQERDLSGEDVVAVVLDGKTFAEATMVIALGITMAGEKRFLGFVETDTENEKVLTPFLRSLVERGLDVSQGVLVILDGGKGLRSAVRKAFRDRALVHRCQWHKRENVVSYLAKTEQASWRQRLQRAYNRPEYDEARAALETLHRELEDRNQSAARSLAEGFDETLTLHRLGLYGVLGRSLKTTNCLESVNALVEERCAKVDHWQNSRQRHRWLATALLDIEPRLRKVMGYRHLPTLRAALKRELKIDTTTSKKKAAESIRSRREFQLRMGLTRAGRAGRGGRQHLGRRLQPVLSVPIRRALRLFRRATDPAPDASRHSGRRPPGACRPVLARADQRVTRLDPRLADGRPLYFLRRSGINGASISTRKGERWRIRPRQTSWSGKRPSPRTPISTTR